MTEEETKERFVLLYEAGEQIAAMLKETGNPADALGIIAAVFANTLREMEDPLNAIAELRVLLDQMEALFREASSLH